MIDYSDLYDIIEDMLDYVQVNTMYLERTSEDVDADEVLHLLAHVIHKAELYDDAMERKKKRLKEKERYENEKSYKNK